MKKLINMLFLSLLFIEPYFLCAVPPGQAPTTINTPNASPFQKPDPQKSQPIHRPKLPSHPLLAKDTGIPIALPGIVGFKDGGWIGSDNLYNLKPNISIYVELVMPENQKFEVNEQDIKTRVQEIFAKAGITSVAFQEYGEPPLPLYHVLVMISSIDQCFMGSCSCRLFESVNLKRVIVEEGITFQAITWEKQNLIAASRKDFYSLLNKTIDDLTDVFVERFQYFQNLKFQRQGNH